MKKVKEQTGVGVDPSALANTNASASKATGGLIGMANQNRRLRPQPKQQEARRK